MTLKLSDLLQLKLAASDDYEAPLVDAYLNEDGWRLDYLVADLGDWLQEQRIVIHARRVTDPQESRWPSDVSRAEMESAPSPADHEAIPEAESGAAQEMPSVILGPAGSVYSPAFLEVQYRKAHQSDESWGGNPKLHSFAHLRDQPVWGHDGELGRIADFRIDSTGRKITFVEVATGGFLRRQSVSIPAEKISHYYADGPYLVLDAGHSDIENTPGTDAPDGDHGDWARRIKAHWSLGH